MSCIHGKNGALSLGGTNIAMLTAWTLNETVDTVECTAMGSTSRTYKAGIKGFEGSADCIWTNDDTTGYVAQFTVGTEYTGVFYVTDSSTAAEDLKYPGQVIITGIEISATMDDVVRASISFQGTGDLTVDADVAL